ncbi:MAG TPA: homoserine kinase [Thermoanaerobaculia bacterium]|jgi:homoserine kinase|nr:homoserine kinase [Thermoanaerobaculia bacterium]
MRAAAFAPGSIGNVGPGLDVLGLAVDGLGDTVTLEVVGAPTRIEAVSGRDAARVPREVERNCAAVAACEVLRRRGLAVEVAITVCKGTPFAGGLGGSAASSVAGARAAQLLACALRGAGAGPADDDDSKLAELFAAALAGESAVAGAHLDNIAPAALGGLALVRSVVPIDVVALPVLAPWWLALWTPAVEIETRAARAMLPAQSERATWVQQMANTAALVHAFGSGDGALLSRALDDRYAEPLRAALIPRFAAVKAAALAAGAFGGSISGSGPTTFAIAADEETARAAAEAMRRAGAVDAAVHVGAIARRGVRAA